MSSMSNTIKEIEISKFDMKIKDNSIIAICGTRGKGKSVLVADILSSMKDIPLVICMSGTEEDDGFYSDIIHPLFVYNKFEPEVLEKLVEGQKEKVKSLRKQGKNINEHHICLVIDNVGHYKSIMDHYAMREIFLNGRYCGITLIITFQYMANLKPDLRNNIDYIFVFKQSFNDNIKSLYRLFFGDIFNNIADFKKVLEACTNDYGCLAAYIGSKSNCVEDQLFWYRADPKNRCKISESNWSKWSSFYPPPINLNITT